MLNIVIKHVHMVIILVIMLHIEHSAVDGVPTGQYLAIAPNNVTIVNTGEHARLRCVVGNKVGQCQWTRDGFGLGTDRNMPNFPRYHMPIDSGNQGVCDLTIEPVLSLDEGVYQCQVSGGLGSGSIASEQVMLSVNSPPSQPQIIQAREVNQLEGEPGDLIELSCETTGARPSAVINWINGEGERMSADVTQHVTRVEDSKMFKTVSVMKFKLQRPEKISCTAHSDAFPIAKVSRSLEVVFGHPPVEETKHAAEGESFVLYCSSDMNIAGMKFKWFMGDTELINETENTLEIQEFSKTYDMSVLKCVVEDHNGHSKTIKTITLKHHSPLALPKALPRTSKKKESIKKAKKNPSKKSNKTIFTCVVEEEETISQPEYVWIDGRLKKAAKEKTKEASDEDGHKMKCKVIPTGYKKIKQMASKMKGISKTMRRFMKTLHKFSEIEEVP